MRSNGALEPVKKNQNGRIAWSIEVMNIQEIAVGRFQALDSCIV